MIHTKLLAVIASATLFLPQEAWTTGVDRTAVVERISSLEESTELDPVVRDQALENYRTALSTLDASDASSARAAELTQEISETEALVSAIRAELEGSSGVLPLPDGRTPLDEMELALTSAESEERSAKDAVDRWEAEGRVRATRVPEIPAELAALQQELTEFDDVLHALDEARPDIEPERGRHVLARARSQSARSEIAALEAERAFYEVRREVLPLRLDRWVRRHNSAKRRVADLRDLVNRKRQEKANDATKEAAQKRREIAARHPELAALAKENENLATARSGAKGLSAELAASGVELRRVGDQLDTLADEFASTKRKVLVAGNSHRMGEALRRQFEKLPRPVSLRREAEAIRQRLADVQYELIVNQEDRDELRDPTETLDSLIAEMDISVNVDDLAQLRSVAQELIDTKRSLLDSLILEHAALSENLFAQVFVVDELSALAGTYRNYVRERILWVASVSGNPIPRPEAFVDAVSWLLNPTSWSRSLTLSLNEFRRRPGTTTLLLVLALTLLVLRRRLRRSSTEASELVRKFRTDAFGLTIRELVRVVALAAPLPLLCGTFGWLLTVSPQQDGPALAVGNGLSAIVTPVALITFLRFAMRRRGLFEAHFRWPAAAVEELRLTLHLLAITFLPMLLIVKTLHAQPDASRDDSLGRLGFILACIAASSCAWRIARRSSAISAILTGEGSSTFLRRRGIVVGTLTVFTPVILSIVAAVGYYYTALQLSGRISDTLELSVGMLLLYSLLLRWLFLTRRKLAVEQGRQRVKAREEAAESGTGGEISADLVEEDLLDLPAVDAQTRRMFRSAVAVILSFGIYFIWADQMPALRILERIQLWPTVDLVSVEEAETSATVPLVESSPDELPSVTPYATQPTENGPVEESAAIAPITLADVILSILLGLLTLIAARNFPGLLEMALLQRLPLDGGLRFAISTLFRYTILILGASAALGALGVGWTSVQWLAAAFTFGLAFGLQEIFANFVSGLIILIERPIRVGDIVTVNGIEGRVTQLRMRSTTIIDWDRRELLVPNKEFITASLINWTLSDPVTRIIVKVGIAYGSDVDLARKLLLEAARLAPGVLDEPKPNAVFLCFGESSLDFELRVFIPDRNQWAPITDEVHTQIDRLFREADIEIAFPQRDVHVRSAEGLAK